MSNSRVSSAYPIATQVNDERWVPPLPDKQKPIDPDTPKCYGCGSYHGSTNVELACMRRTIAELRRAPARAELDRLREEVRIAARVAERLRGELEEAKKKAEIAPEIRAAGEEMLRLRREVKATIDGPYSKGGTIDERQNGRKRGGFAQG